MVYWGQTEREKSTILKMFTGILHPSSGSIELCGQPWNRNALNHIGALIEMPPLYENLTARENLKSSYHFAGTAGYQNRRSVTNRPD